MSTEFSIQKIVDFLYAKTDPLAIYLFGSSINGYFKPESDIDIAVLTEKRCSNQDWFDFSQELAVKTGYSVDLIDLLSVNTVFQIEILKSNRLIYSADEEKRLYFEMKMISEYQKLNEERAIVLKAKWGDDYWKLF